MLILPAIDLIDGKCVRLAQGDYNREKVYGDNPLSVAKGFADEGAEWLHLVDLDGAKSGQPKNLAVVADIVKHSGLKVEFGGGVRSMESAKQLLELGVTRVVVGTKLVQDPELANQMFAELGEQVVAGIDARDGMVAVAGWIEKSEVGAAELAVSMAQRGAKRIILTDIARDGMLTGPNIDLLRDVQSKAGIPVIQSGGIGSLADVQKLLDMGSEAPEGVIIGRAIYEGCLTVSQALALG